MSKGIKKKWNAQHPARRNAKQVNLPSTVAIIGIAGRTQVGVIHLGAHYADCWCQRIGQNTWTKTWNLFKCMKICWLKYTYDSFLVHDFLCTLASMLYTPKSMRWLLAVSSSIYEWPQQLKSSTKANFQKAGNSVGGVAGQWTLSIEQGSDAHNMSD